MTSAIPVFRAGSRVHDCYCDSLLQDSYEGLVFLSLFGTFNSVRTVWARLIEGLSIEVEGKQISLGSNRFSKIRAPVKEGILHTVFIAENATEQPSQARWFFQIGPDAENLFFSRLDRYSSVPFPKDWVSFLWEKGQEKNLIKKLEGFGIPGYKVLVDDDIWSKIVLNQIMAKR